MVLVDWKKNTSELVREYNGVIIENHPLADLNTFGTGGPARLFASVTDSRQLSELVQSAISRDIPVFMLGGGSNLLISDEGFDGLIIKNDIKGMVIEGTSIVCGAGESLQDLIDYASLNGLAGLEFAAGIYGSVGGAIFGNAGAYGAEMKDILEWAELVDHRGQLRIERKDYFRFEYRSSYLKKTREYITRAGFCLKAGNPQEIAARVKDILAVRREKLPSDKPSAGCFFKNIPDSSQPFGKLAAGKLLEEIGAKQARYGQAAVFEKHANILINDGRATSSEIRKLSQMLKQKVKEKFGIELKEEITLLGNFKEENL